MYNKIQKELDRAYYYIEQNNLFNWPTQSNRYDKISNFIYYTNDFKSLLEQIQLYGLDESYIIHRWYNFHTSKTCEKIFCNLGAVDEIDKKNKYVDFYINGIPFDLKVTVYPKKLKIQSTIYNLSKINDKNELIKWFYMNQSQEQRMHMRNRLFIVCNGENNLRLKSNFDKIEVEIKNWLNTFINNPESHNILNINDHNSNVHTVYSDIIEINN